MAYIHAKTAAGRQEIEDRARRLPPALRSMLLTLRKLFSSVRNRRELAMVNRSARWMA
jgi:hypothetical protein